MKLLKLRWSQSIGLVLVVRKQKTVRILPRDLLELPRFNFITSVQDWPEIESDCWHDKVRRALIDMEVTDFESLSLYTKVGLAIALHGLVDGSLSLPDALAAIEKERALI